MSKFVGSIFITNDSKILILKRSPNTDHGSTWSLPGGGPKDKESPLETAKRECKEETGYFPSTAKQIDKIVLEAGQVTIFIFKINQPYNIKLNREHTDYKWVKVPELKKYNLHPAFKKHLDKYIKSLNKKGLTTESFEEFVRRTCPILDMYN